MFSNPKILGLAFIGGVIPSLLWLWFWLKEDKENPEPKVILTAVFFMGMFSVAGVLPIQKFIQDYVSANEWHIILWASAEEIIKFIAVMVILYRTKYIEESIDWPIYLITAALGFAAVENMLFLNNPLSIDHSTAGILSAASLGQLRFLGSTLLHTVASGVLGIALGISLKASLAKKAWYFLAGIFSAIALHSVFNFFIMKIKDGSENYFFEVLRVFGFLWVTTIIVMLLFEKIKRMK